MPTCDSLESRGAAPPCGRVWGPQWGSGLQAQTVSSMSSREGWGLAPGTEEQGTRSGVRGCAWVWGHRDVGGPHLERQGRHGRRHSPWSLRARAEAGQESFGVSGAAGHGGRHGRSLTLSSPATRPPQRGSSDGPSKVQRPTHPLGWRHTDTRDTDVWRHLGWAVSHSCCRVWSTRDALVASGVEHGDGTSCTARCSLPGPPVLRKWGCPLS